MKLYAQTDFEESRQASCKALVFALLFAAPFVAAAVAAFIVRVEWLCIAASIAAGAILIFLYDLRIKPAYAYERYLKEAHSGLTRQTVGMLMRIGVDPVYEDGVNFHEVILNIFEDLAQEGERRFLLDACKEIPKEWVGRDVVATSHGSYLLEVRYAEERA